MKFVERRVCSEFFLAVRSVELSPRFFEHLRRFTNVSLWFGARKILVESCRVYGSDDYVFGEEFLRIFRNETRFLLANIGRYPEINQVVQHFEEKNEWNHCVGVARTRY